MMLLAEELPVNLEVLDAREGVISGVAATLRHLDGERAIIALTPDGPGAGLHWGAHVRFGLQHGAEGYAVTGMVIAHDLPNPAARYSQPISTAPPQITVQLWDCRPVRQQRQSPRRLTRFPVRYRILETETPAETTPEVPEAGQNGRAPEAEEWMRAWSQDIGGGGMRLRLGPTSLRPTRVELRFKLPGGSTEDQAAPALDFCVRGRVLRIESGARNPDCVTLAIKFERLTPEQGLALSNFLT